MALRNKLTGKLFSQEMAENVQKFKVVIEHKLPDYIKDKSQQIVDRSFEQEQFQDGKSAKWKGRKDDAEAGKARTDRRALLVNTGKLIGSVEAEVRGKDTVAIVVNDPEATKYAAVHNEGLKAGRGAGFKMPKRQFMPAPGEDFPELDKHVEKFIDDEMDKIFN